MKLFGSLKKWAFMAALSGGMQLHAQIFDFSAKASPDPVAVSNSLTYTIHLTNSSGDILLNVAVTNAFSGPFQFVSASAPVATNANTVTFHPGSMVNGARTNLTLTVRPVTVGTLTNAIVATTTVVTNIVTTNLVTQVFVPLADLGVTLDSFPLQVLVGDPMTYGVSVTNYGPDGVSSFVLTNTLPPGVILLSASPSNYSVMDSNLIFNLGALANGGHTNFQFTVQPTNSGDWAFSASVVGGLTDTNIANNFVSSNLTVEDFSGTLIATNASTMAYNPQTGLMDQTIRLSNIGTNAVASARVIVAGLTNRLYNAAGTNNGNPYLVYGSTLDTNQSVDLVLEYFIPTRQPITVFNSQYTAVGIPAADFSAPPGTNGVFSITMITNLPNGNILIEFQSIPGRNYTVLYSTNVDFSNALAAQPSVTAPADRTQWIDTGPPKTISAPTNVPARYYRVLLNP